MKAFKSTTEVIYCGIWIMCIIGALVQIAVYFKEDFKNLYYEDLVGLIGMILFAFASLFQQILIYFDIHSLENNKTEAASDYGIWITKTFEKILRYSIFILLLFYVGEITKIFDYLLEEPNVGEPVSFGQEWLRTDGGKHKLLFMFGLSLAFLGQFLWNIFAFIFSNSADNCEDKRLTIINPRIIIFGLSALLSCVYWIVLLLSIDSSKEIAKILIVLYLFFTLLTYIYRYPDYWSGYHSHIKIAISKFKFSTLHI